jgi:hypothetical protein
VDVVSGILLNSCPAAIAHEVVAETTTVPDGMHLSSWKQPMAHMRCDVTIAMLDTTSEMMQFLFLFVVWVFLVHGDKYRVAFEQHSEYS